MILSAFQQPTAAQALPWKGSTASEALPVGVAGSCHRVRTKAQLSDHNCHAAVGPLGCQQLLPAADWEAVCGQHRHQPPCVPPHRLLCHCSTPPDPPHVYPPTVSFATAVRPQKPPTCIPPPSPLPLQYAPRPPPCVPPHRLICHCSKPPEAPNMHPPTVSFATAVRPQTPPHESPHRLLCHCSMPPGPPHASTAVPPQTIPCSQ